MESSADSPIVRRRLCPSTVVIGLPSTASAAAIRPRSLSGVDTRRPIARSGDCEAWRLRFSRSTFEPEAVGRVYAGAGTAVSEEGSEIVLLIGDLSASVAMSAKSSRTDRAGGSRSRRVELEMGETSVD